MSVRELTTAEIESLVDTRHATTGLRYPPNGLQPYYQWLVANMHLLASASAGGLRVDRDDLAETTVRVAPGRVVIDDVVLNYQGGVIDLAVFNNGTAYVWLFDNAGSAAVGTGSVGVGWPAGIHIKLAEVTLSAGVIVATVDRREETIFNRGLEAGVRDSLVQYGFNIVTQGSVSVPSVVEVTARNIRGVPLDGVDYLRVRICDNGGYLNATNATLAAGVNTAVVETISAGKDLVFKSHVDGKSTLSVASSVPETFTLRVGPAALSARRGDYSAIQNVTHA